ncbi:hypothetical protein [Diaphorobacter aerolatus]|uniref:SF3 helicase domain-containing protein n=1 Tax=Diaphorobacter aerolatus TaxID=1288495 RepID=A0A7H0GJD9_9BURK|nr:hypothetical protein [Diaphorobacter aerolatus]QNP48405.1 hypothetical protein H9K75_21020 [Diaphorobacter aerolatus]
MNTLTDNKEKVNTTNEIINDPFGYDAVSVSNEVNTNSVTQEIDPTDTTKLSKFAKLKIEAKVAKDMVRYYELCELEKVYNQEQKEKTKQLKDSSTQQNNQVNPQLEYAWFAKTQTHYSVDVFEENVNMYVWNKQFWEIQSNFEAVTKALNWLEANHFFHANERKATEAYKTATHYMKRLPARPNYTLIPLLNTWIVPTQEGQLEVVEPTMDIGVTYVINTELNTKDLPAKQFRKFNQTEPVNTKVYYEPKPLPESSMFRKFIESSLPDPQVRQLVQEYCGYTLTNSIKHQVAQIWEGDGANGKSVLLKLMEKLHNKVAALDLDKLEGFALALSAMLHLLWWLRHQRVVSTNSN